jgi:hypothetical protein
MHQALAKYEYVPATYVRAVQFRIQGKHGRQALLSNGAEELYQIPIILSRIMHTF